MIKSTQSTENYYGEYKSPLPEWITQKVKSLLITPC